MAHLIEFIDTFFVKRNGIKFTPVRGQNFFEEELTYMTSANIADKITNIIIDYERKLDNIPFVVYDCTAGIGGNTVSFLERREISHVYSYEIVEKRRQMLKNNVDAYKLSNKSTILGEFTGIPDDAVGSVVYMDFPWLPEGISGLNFSKNDYITQNAKVGRFTLEEWLGELTNASMVVYRGPPGYKFRLVPGWDIIVKDDLNVKRNMRLIIAVNLLYPKSRKVENVEKSNKSSSIFDELKQTGPT